MKESQSYLGKVAGLPRSIWTWFRIWRARRRIRRMPLGDLDGLPREIKRLQIENGNLLQKEQRAARRASDAQAQATLYGQQLADKVYLYEKLERRLIREIESGRQS